jgi:hypothetical protein
MRGVDVEGLLRRLSSDGSEAENALRVVAFFDRLVETRGGLEELTRSSARLVGAPAGFVGDSGQRSWAFDTRGREMAGEIADDALTQIVTSDTGPAGTVWIVGEPENTSLAELIVERMALSAGIILGRSGSPSGVVHAPALLGLLVRDASLEERVSHLEALGFRREWSVRVLIASSSASTSPVNELLQQWAHSAGVRCSSTQLDDGFEISLVHDHGDLTADRLPKWPFLCAFGSRTSALEAHDSRETARHAIKLSSATLGPRVVDYETIGPLAHLAELSPAQASTTRLVRQLIFLSQSDSGSGELLALDMFCRHRSLRAASAELNLHHSSLAHRLKNVEKKLQVDLTDSPTVFTLTVALQLYRIAGWA